MEPEVIPTGIAKDNTPGRIDEPGCGNALAHIVEEGGHGIEGEDIAGQEDGGQKRAQCHLAGRFPCVGSRRNPQPQTQAAKDKRHNHGEQSQEGPLNGHPEDQIH